MELTVPVLPSDYSDIDAIRVDSDYYAIQRIGLEGIASGSYLVRITTKGRRH